MYSHGQWQELTQVKEHLQQVYVTVCFSRNSLINLCRHGIDTSIEGQDIVYKRSLGRYVHFPYMRNLTRRRYGFAEDIMLPSTSDNILDELSAANMMEAAQIDNGVTTDFQAELDVPDGEDDGENSE